MITVRKLLSLKTGTRLRKIVSILENAERELSAGGCADRRYLVPIVSLIADETAVPEALRSLSSSVASVLPSGGPEEVLRALNGLRHGLRRALGTEPADWDLFLSPGVGGGIVPLAERSVRPFRVYLDDIRSPFNVGSIFRTAECFCVEKIFLSEAVPPPTHPRAHRTAMGAEGIVPWETADTSLLSKEDGVFALELGGTPLEDFRFPERGTVILGSEELGVSPDGRRLADASYGRVSIPTGGLKGSLNVSVAFGILMYRWFVSHP